MSDTTFIYALCEPGTRTIRYIGKADDPHRRFRHHLNFSTHKKTHLGHWLSKILRESGKPDLLILKEVPKSDWSSWEQCYIRNSKMLGFRLVNSTDGGEGLDNPSQEIREKISASKLGRKRSPETIEKMRVASLGKKYRLGYKSTSEQRAKTSEALRGRKVSPETRMLKRALQTDVKYSWSSSKFLGVSLEGDRWAANIKVEGHRFWLGRYDSETDAALAYDWVANLYGKKLNFPDGSKGTYVPA